MQPFKLRSMLSAVSLVVTSLAPCASPRAAEAQKVEVNHVVEISLTSQKTYDAPFGTVEFDALVTGAGGSELRVPGFWAGGRRWCFRFATEKPGRVAWRTECSDASDAGLHGIEGEIEVTPYGGENPLYRHGPVRVSPNGRRFEHADGTPFFWLGDTWWKCLCKRLTWEGFQELTADRKAKGFTVVQIVCGPYPDEGFLEPRLENEGGLPYDSIKFDQVNPRYFDYADRRLKHLVDAGIAPAIVGAWGRGDCNSMEAIGAAGLKRHWRYLVARYSAYPVFWILAGEIPEETKWGQGPWAEVATYLRSIDPYHRLLTCHTGHGRRGAKGDSHVIDYDMVGGNHDERVAVEAKTLAIVATAYAKDPPMPVLVGETCYEGHMQQGFGDVQRRMFWGSILSGAAGHTYGAAGIWHASVEGDPGCASAAFGGSKVYDWTTWKEGMNYPGATQLGIGKKLLERYPWSRFEPHPEWAPGCIAAGVPGEVRCIYQPRRGIYDWEGTVVEKLEPGVTYHVFYFDPATGRRFDQGAVMYAGPTPPPFKGHTRPLLFEDTFDNADAASWKDYGTPTRRGNSRLVGGKGMVTVAEKVNEADVMASVDAESDAEAGIVLRFHDADNYVVGLYSPHFKTLFIHDRKDGQWGANLGEVPVPEIGPKIHITAAVCGKYAACVLTDGEKTYWTPIVEVGTTAAGTAGLWLYQIGDRQEFDNFALSGARFAPVEREGPSGAMGADTTILYTDEYAAPSLPSPQDWVLVMERVKP